MGGSHKKRMQKTHDGNVRRSILRGFQHTSTELAGCRTGHCDVYGTSGLLCSWVFIRLCVDVAFFTNNHLTSFPRDPITLSVDHWGVQSPPNRKVFRFHYHSQKVIGSVGIVFDY